MTFYVSEMAEIRAKQHWLVRKTLESGINNHIDWTHIDYGINEQMTEHLLSFS